MILSIYHIMFTTLEICIIADKFPFILKPIADTHLIKTDKRKFPLRTVLVRRTTISLIYLEYIIF